MKNFKITTRTLIAVSSLCLAILSCKKDDEPFVKPKLSFESDALSKKESAGTVKLAITLDKATDKGITISYSLDGTAVEKTTVASGKHYDYEDLTKGEVVIAKGEKTGNVELKFLSDLYYETDQTIQISIDDVDYDKIEVVTSKDQMEVTLAQEDGLIIGLGWDNSYTDVDMDIILWATIDGTLQATDVNATRISFTPPEVLFVPSVPFADGNYGVSYVFYEGSPDPMNFSATLLKYADGAEGTPVTKTGVYHKENINKWDGETGTAVILAQTYKKTGNDYTDISALTIQAQGSRIGNSYLPANLVKGQFKLIE